MFEGTQPRMARGTKLTAGVAVGLFALLAFVPSASAATDPVATGSATVTLKNGFVKSLKKRGVKVTKLAPAKLKGRKATFTVGTGSSMDPTTGAGTLNLQGGLRFKAGKHKAPVKALVIDTAKKGLFAKVGGKRVKLAALAGWSFARAGFGVSLTIKKLKLTNAAAKQLNKRLGFKKGKKPFHGNRLMAGGGAEEQPATVTLLPVNNIVYDANAELLKKLKDVEVTLETIAPTAAKGLTTFEFPISGGSIAPAATAGVVNSSGGLKLTQKLPTNPEKTKFIETEISLTNFYGDLGAKTVGVEVIAHSNAETEPGKKPLDLGVLPRTSIANLSLTGATVVSDPTNRKVTVQNAGAALQPVSAEVLDGFVKVYEGWLVQVLMAEGKSEAEAKAIAAKKVEGDHIKENDPLGNFSLTAQTQ